MPKFHRAKTNMKKSEELVRKVTRVGKRSLSIVIPAEIVAELGIRERQKMVFNVERKKIIISDWK
jgi:bifunctional DNA-binding transcriptional regulator/antitoxin component of YhaV-PrlF toxin-antitoxin module